MSKLVTKRLRSTLHRLLTAAALAVVLTGCSSGRVSSETSSERVDRYFQELAEQGMFNGNALIAVDGQVVLRSSYAVPSAPDGLATAEDDQFILASVSKLLIRYAFYTLEDAARLSLDTPISHWVEGLPYGDRVSVEHLISHSSGLPRELEGIDELTRISSEEFLRLAGEEALLFEPGTDTLYSNVGYQLLAELLAAFSQSGYDALIAECVTEPIGMVDTAEYLSRVPDRLAQGFELDGDRIVPGDLVELERFRYLRLYSTIDDLYRFGSALFDRSVTAETVLERMMFGKEAVSHAGAMEGYRAYFHANPENRTIVIFLSNLEDIPFIRIIEDVPKILAGEQYEVPQRPNRVAVEVDSELLMSYVGRYRLDVDPDQVFEVRFDGARLEVIDIEGESSVLFAESSSAFFEEPSSSDTVEFKVDPATGDSEMSLIIEGGMRLETTRID